MYFWNCCFPIRKSIRLNMACVMTRQSLHESNLSRLQKTFQYVVFLLNHHKIVVEKYFLAEFFYTVLYFCYISALFPMVAMTNTAIKTLLILYRCMPLSIFYQYIALICPYISWHALIVSKVILYALLVFGCSSYSISGHQNEFNKRRFY